MTTTRPLQPYFPLQLASLPAQNIPNNPNIPNILFSRQISQTATRILNSRKFTTTAAAITATISKPSRFYPFSHSLSPTNQNCFYPTSSSRSCSSKAAFAALSRDDEILFVFDKDGTLIDLQAYLAPWAKSNLTAVAKFVFAQQPTVTAGSGSGHGGRSFSSVVSNKNETTSTGGSLGGSAGNFPGINTIYSSEEELYTRLCCAMRVDADTGHLLSSQCFLVTDSEADICGKLQETLVELGIPGVVATEATRVFSFAVKTTDTSLTSFGDIRQMVLELRGIFPLAKFAIATADKEANTHPTLRQLNTADLFDVVVCDDSCAASKPSPDVIQEVKNRINQMALLTTTTTTTSVAPKLEQRRPPQVVMIGDSTHDIRMGNLAGCISVGVLSGVYSEAELTCTKQPENKADFIIPNVQHLPALVKTWLKNGC